MTHPSLTYTAVTVTRRQVTGLRAKRRDGKSLSKREREREREKEEKRIMLSLNLYFFNVNYKN